MSARAARKRADEEAQQTSQYARSLIEASLDPLVTISPEGKITDVNEATVKVTGIARGALIGTDFSDYFTEPERAREGYELVFAEGSVTDYPLTIRHRDSTLTDVLYNASVYRDALGVVLGVFAAARDVTVQNQAEAKFRGLLEGAPDAIIVVDGEGVIRIVNGQTEALFGYQRDEILGQPIEVLVPDGARRRHRASRGPYLAAPETRPMGVGLELSARRRDGSEFPVDVSLAPVQTSQGILVSAAVRDVTVQQQARTEMVRANQAKSEFLSRMSHELRTPLNAILGFGQLLEMDQLSAEQRYGVEHIIDAGRHLLRLVDEVLDISQVESGAMRLSLEPVSVSDVVDEAVGMLRPLADRRSVGIEVAAVSSSLHVRADRQRLRQVVVNLLANAVKYNRDGGQVRVDCELMGSGRLRLIVSDTGIGIAVDDLGRLFQPFERLSAEPSAVEGTGLGLAVTKHIVNALGGDVGATSRVGEGSSFWIELATIDVLPGDGGGTTSLLVDAPPTTSAGAATVLYVEDNLSNVELLEWIVARRPATTLVVAMNGRLALELARRHRPDLILLDLHLPDISGEEVLRRLKGTPRTADIPVVVLSADATCDRTGRLLAEGASDYLTKPFDIVRLLAVIDALGTDGHPTDGPTTEPAYRMRGRGEGALDQAIVASLHELNVDSGGGATGLARLVTRFIDESETRLAEMHVAVRDADAGRVERLAHSLAGSSVSFGAWVLGRGCRDLETAAQTGALAGASVLVGYLEEDFAHARSALRAEFGDAEGPTML